jgi:hypothetical protein
MSRIFSVVCTLLLVAAFTPSTTRADTVFITSGTLTVTGPQGGPNFILFGNNFFAVGGGERGASGPQITCSACTSGSFVTVFGNFVGSSLGGGAIIFNGVDHSGGFAGAFSLTGPPLEIPFSLSNISVTSPFVFSGRLISCPQDCFVGPQVFSVDLIGGGAATIDLLFSGLTSNGKAIFTFQKVTYNFEVPEPASLLLLGGGLALLGAMLRRRTRRK